MMAPPVDVAGLRPRLGDVEAPPKPRSSLSSVAEVESEPLGRARRRPSAEARAESEPWGRAERSSSSSGAEPKSEPWVRQSGVRRLSGLSPSSSPRSGGAEFAVFWDLARVRALGRAERSSPSSGTSEPSVKWHRSRSGAGGAVLLSGLGMATGTYPSGSTIPYPYPSKKFYPSGYPYILAGIKSYPYPYPRGYFYPSGNPYPLGKS
jgi:hypothetical protein